MRDVKREPRISASNWIRQFAHAKRKYGPVFVRGKTEVRSIEMYKVNRHDDDMRTVRRKW